MNIQDTQLINWEAFSDAKSMLGNDFVRILGYFREDGLKSVAAIENAVRDGEAARLVIPAHTLKGEAYQFGAERLAEIAEYLEMTSRQLVETHQRPDELVKIVVDLRPTFEQSLEALEKESNPLMKRGAFGRKAVLLNSGFGRAS